MNNFLLKASLWGGGIYERFLNNEISSAQIISTALCEGVNDPEDYYKQTLDDVCGLAGGYLLTYDQEEDIFDVWVLSNE